MILRSHFNAVKTSIWMDTLPKVHSICCPDLKLKWNKTDTYVGLPNEAEIWCGGLDDKERVEKILGREYATMLFNECSQIPYASVVLALTRLAQKCEKIRNRAYYDLNPVGMGHWSYKQFIQKKRPDSRTGELLSDPEDYAHFFLNPTDNAQNIDKAYIEGLQNLPERTRRRFFEGRYVAEMENALWTMDSFSETRTKALKPGERQFKRIIVAVDPSGSSGEDDLTSDEIGIVVAGLIKEEGEDRAYVLEDATGRYSPEQWGSLACQLYWKWSADKIVGERNFGGDMVRAIVTYAAKNVKKNVAYGEVVASRGKAVRAEPIAALYEQKRIRHAGEFPVLEEQYLNFTTAGYLGSGSPDAADSAIWALSELMGNLTDLGLVDYLREETGKLEAAQAQREVEIKAAMPALVSQHSVQHQPPITRAADAQGCPTCGCLGLQKIPASRQVRCQQCGKQWDPTTGLSVEDAARARQQAISTDLQNTSRGMLKA